MLQGERERAVDNKSLGRFDLADIPLAPRGLPQIDVAFDIDVNGILNVSAKDKATAKEQNIVIKASSGLDDGEIERMVKDAEAHQEEDRKFRETVETRNRADALVHATEKSLADLGDKVEVDERARIESAVSDLKEALKGDDKDRIETKAQALAEASAGLAQRIYSEQQQQKPGQGNGAATDGGGGEDVVDAEFEEVKDDGDQDSKSA